MGTDPPLEIQGASAASFKTTFGANLIKKHLKNSGASPKCLNNHAAFFGAVGLGSGPHFCDPSGWAGAKKDLLGQKGKFGHRFLKTPPLPPLEARKGLT